MKFREIKILTEVKTTASTLSKFSLSKAAEGIRVGFEAEVILGSAGQLATEEPDYSYNYTLLDTNEINWSKVIDFFSDPKSQNPSSRESVQKRLNLLNEKFSNWFAIYVTEKFEANAYRMVQELARQQFKRDELALVILKNAGFSEADIAKAEHFYNSNKLAEPLAKLYAEALKKSNTELDAIAVTAIEKQNSLYQRALNKYTEDMYTIKDRLFKSFLLTQKIYSMISLADKLEITWPHWKSDNSLKFNLGYSVENANLIAKSLQDWLNVSVKVGSVYHEVDRDDQTWIIEPDNSIKEYNAGEIPLEIISPPLPLRNCLTIIKSFFDWVKRCNGRSNSSTGFHINISLPDMQEKQLENVDLVKLAVLMADKHVLEEFQRSASKYTESFIEKMTAYKTPAQLAVALTALRRGYYSSIHRALIPSDGFGKMTSVVGKRTYIEFRAAGHAAEAENAANYFDNINKLQMTVMRFAKALSLAADDTAVQKEYAVKLYKLLQPNFQNYDYLAQILSLYMSGNISKELFLRYWSEKVINQEIGDRSNVLGYKLININDRESTPIKIFQDHGYNASVNKSLAFLGYTGLTADDSMYRAGYRVLPLEPQDVLTKPLSRRTQKALNIRSQQAKQNPSKI